MKNQKPKYLMIGIAISVCLVLFGLGGYYIGKQNKPSSLLPLPATTLTETVNPTIEWKTYSNNDYSFQIDYPNRFKVIEIGKREPFHDTLAKLVSQSESTGSLTLQAIHDVDIYKNEKPENVAKREIMDSGGFKYHINTAKIGDYSMAITTFDIISPDIKSTILTIAHPSKNLFIVIDINADLSLIEFEQLLSTFKFITPATSIDTSSLTLYTNKTFGYSLKFPTTYQVKPQTAKHISQVGLDNNTVVEKKSDPSGNSVIVVDVNQDKDNLSLGGYMDKNMKMFGIDGPLQGGMFNGVYDSVFNKNQPGANVFVKQGQYVYHITAPTASSDKEVGDIVETFKFTQ